MTGEKADMDLHVQEPTSWPLDTQGSTDTHMEPKKDPKPLLHADEPALFFPSRRLEGKTQVIWQSELDNIGAKNKVITYDMQALSRWGVFMVFNGTVLDVTFIWVQAGLVQILSWLVVVLLLISDTEPESLQEASLRDAVMTLNRVLGFCLGLYVNNGIYRWWSMRKLLGKMIANTNSMLLTICTYQPSNSRPNLNLKRKLVRYAAASIPLLFEDLKDYEDLKKQGLLTEEECAELKTKSDPSCTLWAWNAAEFHGAVKSKVLDLETHVRKEVHHHCVDTRNAIQLLKMYTNTPLPLPYVHLLIGLTKILFLMLIVESGLKMYKSIKNEEWLSLVIEVFVQVVVPISYQGLIDLAEKISNPLSGDEVDFPGGMYKKTLIDTCNEFIETIGKRSEQSEQFYTALLSGSSTEMVKKAVGKDKDYDSN